MSDKLISKLHGNDKLILALYDFEWDDPTIDKSFKNELIDELVIKLESSGQNRFGNVFSIVDRKFFRKRMEELNFQLSDLSDPKNAKRIGKSVSANIIMIGSLYVYNDFLKITSKFIDVETGKILASSTDQIIIDGYVAQAIGRKVKGQLVVSGEEGVIAEFRGGTYPLKRDESLIRVDPGVGSVLFLKPGYKPLLKEFEMIENGDLRYHAISIIEPSLSYKCLVANIIPGYSISVANRSTLWASWSGTVGLATYCSGGIYLVDLMLKPNNFMDSGMEKKYKSRLKSELTVTGIIYLLNLVSGLMHGIAEVEESKRVILVQSNDFQSNLNFAGVNYNIIKVNF
ncbi:MAG: hypothetical protein J0L62_03015 [Bacteroidetes bacterium]|nr:hypothetical protein [Bacteroidota bacterium]